MTVYAFSTENWKRSAEEVGALMGLLLAYFSSEIDELDEKNVCIRILGDVDGLPQPQRDAVNAAMARTKDNAGLKLNIALNYGGRDEIIHAAKRYARDVAEGRADGELTEEQFSDYLYSAGIPDPDLLIRPGGEQRISNFLLWQCAYSEFYFTDVLWPDFTPHELDKAIAAFRHRDRRYGGVKNP